MNIYLDMDDVVADWTRYTNDFFGTPGREATHHLPELEWAKLKTKQRMYEELPLKAGAYELVAMCAEYCAKNRTLLAFLTALPHDDSFPYAAYDKVRWAENNFPGIPVFFGPHAKDKYKFSKPGDLLIDDRLSNCQEWVKAGGRAYQYTTWQDCKPWLQEQLK